jgi:hypothetical protein
MRARLGARRSAKPESERPAVEKDEARMDEDDAPAAPFNWRDHLPVHPAADLFPLLSETDPKALRELAEDIRKNGLQQPIVIGVELDGGYSLLDGRNRLDALAMSRWLSPARKVDDPKSHLNHLPHINGADDFEDAYKGGYRLVYPVWDDQGQSDLHEIALSLNVHRRHLTAEQKRDVIAKVLMANPEQSNRSIAKQVNGDGKTVASVRRDLEATAEIPQLEKTVGADGKARKQPKMKPALPDKVTVNGHAMDVGRLGPAAQEQIATVLELEKTPQQITAAAAEKQFEAVIAKLPTSWDTEPAPTACGVEANADVTAAATNDQATIIAEANSFHREIMGFLTALKPRIESWSHSNTLPDGARRCVHNALMMTADALMTIAQEVDGRGHSEAAA